MIILLIAKYLNFYDLPMFIQCYKNINFIHAVFNVLLFLPGWIIRNLDTTSIGTNINSKTLVHIILVIYFDRNAMVTLILKPVCNVKLKLWY